MNNLIINNLGSNDIGKSNQRNQIDITGTRNYINNSNIINENSSDNDIEISNLEKEKDIPQSSNNLSEKELRRFTLEYIKVLGIYEKKKIGQEIKIKEIMEEYEIPKEIFEEKKNEIINQENSDLDSINENKECNIENIDFDNDIQPTPSLSHEMKIVIYLSKPQIIGFNGKLGLFYISPTQMGKDGGYNIIVKNPENMQVIFKIKIIELITCVRKNEKTIYIQNFGTKVLSKTNHEITFKNGEDCSLVYQGIVYLMNNKEDDAFY